MGALITMRDEPSDAPIPEILEPRTEYHDERLVTARARLAELTAMSIADRVAATTAWNTQNDADRRQRVLDNDEQRNRYNAMLAQVVQWRNPPAGIKEFMTEQLIKSREFDCPADPCEFMPTSRSVDEWFSAELKKASRDIEYHEGERAKEIARTAERNAWLQQFRSSLPDAPA